MAPQTKPRVYTAARREMVKHPLTPSIMSEIGALDAASLPAGRFEPNADWKHIYRVWTCYGYRSGSNRDQGELTISRSRDSSRDGLHLAVEQSIRMDPKKEPHVHHITAEIDCRTDELASPTSWTFTSRFTRGAGDQPQPALDHAEQGRLRDGALEVVIAGQRYERIASRRLTADWCLFEAVQRMAFGRDGVLQFDLMEGLTVWKPGQRLSYRGEFPVDWSGRPLALYCFQQLGMGVWPYEYWLDGQHRLLLVITGARAYIWSGGKGGEQ